MDCQFGIRGNGYVLLASDQNAQRSIVQVMFRPKRPGRVSLLMLIDISYHSKMKNNEDKMRVVGKYQVIAFNGEPGDTVHFAEYVQANLKLNSIRNHSDTNPAAAAAWIRNSLATSLRSRKPYNVNLLLGGYDQAKGVPHLYWIDYLGTIAEVPYAAHGYGAYFCLSTMDRYHDPSAGLEAGMEVLKRCINELQTRFIIDLGQWNVRIITKDGIREEILHPIPPPSRPKPASDVPMEAIQPQTTQQIEPEPIAT